jgi:hypothetical protein
LLSQSNTSSSDFGLRQSRTEEKLATPSLLPEVPWRRVSLPFDRAQPLLARQYRSHACYEVHLERQGTEFKIKLTVTRRVYTQQFSHNTKEIRGAWYTVEENKHNPTTVPQQACYRGRRLERRRASCPARAGRGRRVLCARGELLAHGGVLLLQRLFLLGELDDAGVVVLDVGAHLL